ncbi:uncharacterized protein si:ch73-204p21.2 [Acanthochromis polyacanthus]|uniref:uncharacterized protein si:ch73-204p21.2 n=1 Tax=Acanthochromis polyacanthus TaxID=80966 RepID=UPI000B8FAEDE|nr:uncharacterized protein si:ch73-204p21.2 [Acanthochromis polyacanthus]
MAAVGAELSGFWFLSSGSVGFFILLILLLVFLTSLCSDCNRRSFELKDPEVDRNPSSLIRVVKLEEARENPMIDEIQNDEKEFGPEGSIPWRSHVGAPQSQTESGPEEAPVSFPPWRSHLVAPQSHDSAHVYDVINGGRSSNDALSLTANQNGDPNVPPAANLNSIYARVSKKMNVSDSPGGLPGDSPEERRGEEEEPKPPLPDRRTDMD